LGTGELEDVHGVIGGEEGVNRLGDLDELGFGWVGGLADLDCQTHAVAFGVVRPDGGAADGEAQDVGQSALCGCEWVGVGREGGGEGKGWGGGWVGGDEERDGVEEAQYSYLDNEGAGDGLGRPQLGRGRHACCRGWYPVFVCAWREDEWRMADADELMMMCGGLRIWKNPPRTLRDPHPLQQHPDKLAVVQRHVWWCTVAGLLSDQGVCLVHCLPCFSIDESVGYGIILRRGTNAKQKYSTTPQQ